MTCILNNAYHNEGIHFNTVKVFLVRKRREIHIIFLTIIIIIESFCNVKFMKDKKVYSIFAVQCTRESKQDLRC